MLARSAKPNRCKFCRERMPLEQARHVLHDACIDPWLAVQTAKKQRKAKAEQRARARVEKAETRAEKERRKTLPDLHKEARYWFNRMVRMRDAHLPCISCGKPPPDLSGLHAGRDAGHYRSVGSAGHLRYTPDNVAGQCVHCNQFLAGNPIGYRRGLIDRIGLERVEALENDNQPDKWQRDQIRAIRDDSKAQCKALEAAGEQPCPTPGT